MGKLDELLAGLTPEHGIADDFVEAVRAAYDADIADLNSAHELSVNEINSANATATETLTTAHAAEIERVRSERYEQMQDGEGDSDVLPDSIGDQSADKVTIDTYWIEAE